MRHTTPLQYCAIAWAIVLLGLQIMAGLEYTEGGSVYARLSMIATMVTLAGLPVFLESARRTKSYGIGAALAVAFIAFLTYSLPATIGRTGEVKETKVLEAKASGEGRKLLEQELTRAHERLDLASRDVKGACSKTSYSDNCEGWKRTEKERQARVDQIRKELGHAPVAKVGDIGGDNIAWALTYMGVPAEAVRRFTSISFALGLDVIIWALIWFGSSDKVAGRKRVERAPANDVEPLPPKQEPIPLRVVPTDSEVKKWRADFVEANGRLPRGKELQAAFDGIPKTSAWRYANCKNDPRDESKIRRIRSA